jgi:tungstate transport system substrate-binding protein
MRGLRRLTLPLLAAVLVAGLALPAALPRGPQILLATTTSTEDSGLLDYLLPRFTAETGIAVRVVAVGTGQALELGRRGDADVVLTHAPRAEQRFLAEGHAVNRTPVMFNQFVLVGPASDPAGVRSGLDIAHAFGEIAACACTFVSRGDGSGTHVKELELWDLTDSRPSPSGWYKEAGQGMGATLRIADQLHGYTLSDDGTFFTMGDRVGLVVIVENDPRLLNQYSVMPVNPAMHPAVHFDLAQRFAAWLTGADGQSLIASYTVRGRPIFTPNAP